RHVRGHRRHRLRVAVGMGHARSRTPLGSRAEPRSWPASPVARRGERAAARFAALSRSSHAYRRRVARRRRPRATRRTREPNRRPGIAEVEGRDRRGPRPSRARPRPRDLVLPQPPLLPSRAPRRRALNARRRDARRRPPRPATASVPLVTGPIVRVTAATVAFVSFTVIANGDPVVVPDGATVADLLTQMGLGAKWVIVERNGEPVSRR